MPVVINEMEIIAVPQPEQPPRATEPAQQQAQAPPPRPEDIIRVIRRQDQRIDRVRAD